MKASDPLDDLGAATRILAGLGVLDGFGHVSIRHPGRTGRYLPSRSLAPQSVTRDDIMAFDFDSNAQDGDARTPLSRALHPRPHLCRARRRAA